MTKVIIAGSRGYKQRLEFDLKLHEIFHKYNITPTEIVSGGAIGPDKMAIEFAIQSNIPYREFKPAWKLLGRSAGFIRNEDMARYVFPNGILIVFWDGRSKGTKHMINIAERKKIKTYVVNVKIKPINVNERKLKKLFE